MPEAAAAFDLVENDRTPVLALRGDWTVDTIASVEADLRALDLKSGSAVDVARLGRMDMAGAYLVVRTMSAAHAGEQSELDIRGEHANARRLLDAARKAATEPAPLPEHLHGWRGLLERIGRAVAAIGEELIESISFFGQTLATLAGLAANPRRIRAVSIVHVMEEAGLNALPIVVLLAFFIGLVIAYLGARILGDFGASVFTVELVAFSMMREFGVVITAVLLAGRTNSAFTAEIGAMKMRQEIDAMRTMGIQPMESLVAPRVVAMLIMTPLLTFGAIMAGLLGGLLVCWSDLGISPVMFFSRIADEIPARHFWVGMVKAPVFALVLTVIACKQGLSVGGDVNSLGRHVTSSVVQAIFMIILLDALFAIWFLEMDL
ncbi:MAG: ABC transporter permease [Proteobacteria bacterium]|nr:ABC transporter permease [Pseudomonadota bacterium]